MQRTKTKKPITRHRVRNAPLAKTRPPVFVGAFVSPAQRESLRGLAHLRGLSVSDVLRGLIDDAASRAANATN